MTAETIVELLDSIVINGAISLDSSPISTWSVVDCVACSTLFCLENGSDDLNRSNSLYSTTKL